MHRGIGRHVQNLAELTFSFVKQVSDGWSLAGRRRGSLLPAFIEANLVELSKEILNTVGDSLSRIWSMLNDCEPEALSVFACQKQLRFGERNSGPIPGPGQTAHDDHTGQVFAGYFDPHIEGDIESRMAISAPSAAARVFDDVFDGRAV